MVKTMERDIDIAYLEKNFYQIYETILSTGMIVNISSEKGDVIMMPKEKYNSLIETLYLSSNLEIKKSIIDGMNATHDECVSEKEIH